jgi:hypothetical protein
MNCPRCEGKGKQSIGISEYGQPEESFEMTCMTCKGSGEVTAFEAEMFEQEQGMWCGCGNPSNDGDFYEDGEDPVVGKHHWKCKDCKKVLQVG